ncbi:tRNA1(Val) (adenine(37)-N6)-methyltransferase [Microvirga massiliensis]|uniref:tRNA1(Val) (adenine(37)-N6)-methyltransferase n=1 Tax=Microvirga massiliensis TaxID=1033741 RepID=UPI00062B4DB7|nr:methyltransferase [Microvirga massiliensis]
MAEPGDAACTGRNDVTRDQFLGGRVTILQPARGHRAGTDAVLLAAATVASPGERVIDVGAATGAVGLMITAATKGLDLVLLEKDPDLAALCRENLLLNGVEGLVANADLLDPASRAGAGVAPEAADVVVTNPPFFEAGRVRSSPEGRRASAHVLPSGGIREWLRAAAALLKPRGRLVLIHRADRLPECLAALGRGFGGLQLRFVHPQTDEPAIRFVLTAVKGSRAPIRIEPPLVLHAGGRFTPEAEAVHRGAASLK